MTLNDIRADVFRRLRELSDAPVYWSADDVDAAINETNDELADETEWNEQWITIDLLTDRPYYDLRTVVGASLLSIGPAYHEDTNRWFIPSTAEELDSRDRRWETATGTPQRVLTKGLWWVGLWPRIQSEGGTWRQYYANLPDPLADDADVPGFPAQYHDALTEGATSILLAEDGQTTNALLAWQMYLEFEAKLTDWKASRVRVPMRTMRG